MDSPVNDASFNKSSPESKMQSQGNIVLFSMTKISPGYSWVD
jgi:hypothetical protein